MSKPVSWLGSNKTLKAPKGTTEEQVQDLPIFTNGKVCVSCWQLSEEALKEVINTGCIFLSIYSGSTQPPVFMGSQEEVRAVAVDYGPVWKISNV